MNLSLQLECLSVHQSCEIVTAVSLNVVEQVLELCCQLRLALILQSILLLL